MMAGKERSPNYPAIDLETAVQMIRKVYEKERRTAVATDLVGKALGHPNLSGSALTKIGALRQFGLLENVERGKVKVSEDAMNVLLLKPEEPDYWKAMRQIALNPQLFADLYRDYAAASDDALRYNLVKDRNFSEEGASKVIKAFRSTIAFAKLNDENYNREQESEKPAENPGGGSVDSLFQIKVPPKRPNEGGGGSGHTGMALTYILPGGVNAQLTFAGSQPTPKAVQRLIEYLAMLKADLPEPETEPVSAASAADTAGAD